MSVTSLAPLTCGVDRREVRSVSRGQPHRNVFALANVSLSFHSSSPPLTSLHIMTPISESVVEATQALCKEGNNTAHEDHHAMNARLLVQEFVRKFSESEKKVRV